MSADSGAVPSSGGGGGGGEGGGGGWQASITDHISGREGHQLHHYHSNRSND